MGIVFDAGVKTAFDWKRTAMGAVAAGTGVLGIYDIIKTRGHGKDLEKVQKAIASGKSVDSRAFVKKIDPKIKVLSTESEIKRAIAKEPSIGALRGHLMASQLAEAIRQGRNAFALPGERGSYVIVPKSTNAQVLAHEIGHILDFRKQGLTIKNPGPYKQNLLSMFWKPSHESRVMSRERMGWEMAPGRRRPTALERSALNTYDKSFHGGRAAMSLATAATLTSALLKRADIQTAGEMRANDAAPGVTGRGFTDYRVDEHVVRRPGGQGGRGLPEWLRRLSQPPGQTTDTLPGDRT